jgi:quinol monooxygenase YgiN
MTYLRWSELEIDPARLELFRTLAEENVREARRTEPGVVAFHWASERDRPTLIRVFEAYADASAYQAHLQSPHFQKFRAASSHLVTSRRLFEAVPVKLGAKPLLPPSDALVRIAELEIDPGQLEEFKAIVGEEIDASIRVEPGVFAIYALALAERPIHLRFYEIYADEQAYQRHLDSPHFKKYVEASHGMISARRLVTTSSALPAI